MSTSAIITLSLVVLTILSGLFTLKEYIHAYHKQQEREWLESLNERSAAYVAKKFNEPESYSKL